MKMHHPSPRAILATTGALLYPLCVYGALSTGWGRGVLIGALILAGLRIRSASSPLGLLTLTGAVASAGVLVPGLLLDETTALLYAPAAVNGALALLFTWSVLRPPPIIEQIARLQEPELPPAGVRYCRQVTLVWIGFFLLNGGISLWTARAALEWWTVYNGLLSYLGIGALFVGEYLIRQRVRQRLRRSES